MLIAACRPHPTSDYSNYGGRDALFYPTNLPITTSLEIANYPILDAIRSSLFPNLPPGQYLTSIMDRLDVIDSGSHLSPHSPSQLRNDDRSATIIITLPVRFRGGAIVVRDSEGREERFQGNGGKNGDIDWVALRNDCTYEVEPVDKGVQLSISYGVFIKSFGPTSPTADTLVTPTDKFFDLLSPILNLSRGKSIAFYLNYDYNVNPAEAIANVLVSQVRRCSTTPGQTGSNDFHLSSKALTHSSMTRSNFTSLRPNFTGRQVDTSGQSTRHWNSSSTTFHVDLPCLPIL